MNLEKIARMNPIIAALAWAVSSNRVSTADVELANTLKNSPQWEGLTPSEKQWVDMLIGANLSTEDTRAAVTRLLVSELSEV